MRKIIFILIVMVLLIVSACTSSQEDIPIQQDFRQDFRIEEGIHIFDVDYLEKYEDTLNAMFDDEWTVLTVEERYVSLEEMYMRAMIRSVPTPVIKPEQFTEWTIEYRDGNGDVKHFVFNNRSDFSRQIMQHVSNDIAEFYREKFFDDDTMAAMGVSSLEVSSVGVRGELVRLHMFTLRMDGDPAMIELDDTTREYKSLLSTPEGAINLSALTPTNIFEMVPFYLRIPVRLSEYADFDQQSVEPVVKQIEEILEEMNDFTNHRLNVSVSISSLTHGGADGDIRVRHHGPLHYTRGQKVFEQRESNFHTYLFESYRGVFWE